MLPNSCWIFKLDGYCLKLRIKFNMYMYCTCIVLYLLHFLTWYSLTIRFILLLNAHSLKFSFFSFINCQNLEWYRAVKFGFGLGFHFLYGNLNSELIKCKNRSWVLKDKCNIFRVFIHLFLISRLMLVNYIRSIKKAIPYVVLYLPF